MTTLLHTSDLRRVSEKGWVVIPQELREKYGLRPGKSVRFVDYGGVMGIVPEPEDAAARGYGMLRDKELTQALLEQRRRDKEQENER
jgi:AbrB family looped-hinge helix DNA binding protein